MQNNNIKKPQYYIPQQEKTYEVNEAELMADSKTVLLLDDDSATTEVLKQVLEANNFRVQAVRDGVQGLKTIISQDFDVVLCDMMMPNLPGDMFYVAVERVKPHMAKRFVFITGYKGDPKVNAFIMKIKGLILFKPVQVPVLVETINMVIAKSRQPAPSPTEGSVVR